MNFSACGNVESTMDRTACLAVLFLLACDPKSAEPEPEPEPCTDLDEFGCDIVECVEIDGTLRCAFEVYAEPGNALDIALQVPGGGGDLDWNAWPWNADAGAFEDYNLVGDEAVCGEFSLDIEGAVERGYSRPTMVTLVCTDWTAGVFTTSEWSL